MAAQHIEPHLVMADERGNIYDDPDLLMPWLSCNHRSLDAQLALGLPQAVNKAVVPVVVARGRFKQQGHAQGALRLFGACAMGGPGKAKAKEEQECQHKGHGAEWEHGFSLE